jgi:hypothetical protein
MHIAQLYLNNKRKDEVATNLGSGVIKADYTFGSRNYSLYEYALFNLR